MTEVSFAKTFLSTLESRPIKLQSDYVSDPKTFEPKGPYTLPRMPKPMQKRPKPSAPGSTPSTTILLKSLRNPPLEISLSAQSLDTSVLDLKAKVAEQLGEKGTEKIRLLYKKKPCTDSKTVKDVIGKDAATVSPQGVEFSVMVIGALTTSAAQTSEDVRMSGAEGTDGVKEEVVGTPVAQGVSGEEVLKSDLFWEDLRGFLVQRIRDEAEAGKVYDLFLKAWKGER